MEPRRIMVVSENQSFVELVSATVEENPTLELIGTARNATEALAQLRRARPHLMLIDPFLPGMSGLELTHRIKHKKNPPRIVLTTLDDGPLHRSSARQVQADGILKKSVLRSQLPDLVRGLFSLTREHRR